MKRITDRINGLSVVWLLGLSAVAFVEPRTMLWFDQRWIFWSLAVSLLGMGLSLAPEDFRAAAGVFSGVMQNVLGGLLATFWKRREAGR